jgi:hypothetical protein
MTAQFKLGDKVKAIQFTNCFGKIVEEVSGLTVVHINHVQVSSIKDYYRVAAEKADGPTNFVEGAERFFERERES